MMQGFYLMGASNILCEYSCTKAILGRVCPLNGLLLGLELAEHNKWPKDLFLIDFMMLLVQLAMQNQVLACCGYKLQHP